MGSHSYLVNLNTNIGDLHTSGLLNSHASRFTTTNVGHIAGDRTSVITLGELQELGLFDKLRNHVHEAHFTRAQADKIEAEADAVDAAAHKRIEASTKLSAAQKAMAEKLADAVDARTHKFVEAHTDAALEELNLLDRIRAHVKAVHFTRAQADKIEAEADAVENTSEDL